MKKLMLFVFVQLILSLSAYADPKILAVCEGSDLNQAYLIQFYQERTYQAAQIYRYASSGHGDEYLERVGSEVLFYDDIFEDAGIVHHLMDVGSEYENPASAQIHVSYRADGAKNIDEVYIKIYNEDNALVKLENTVCSLFSEALAE